MSDNSIAGGRSRAGVSLHLGPVEVWICAIVGTIVSAGVIAGIGMLWRINVSIARMEERWGGAIEAIRDHETRIRAVERR